MGFQVLLSRIEGLRSVRKLGMRPCALQPLLKDKGPYRRAGHASRIPLVCLPFCGVVLTYTSETI